MKKLLDQVKSFVCKRTNILVLFSCSCRSTYLELQILRLRKEEANSGFINSSSSNSFRLVVVGLPTNCQKPTKSFSPTQHFYISVEKTFSWKILLPKKSPLSLDRPSNQNQTTFFHRRSSPPLSTTSRRTSPCSRNRSKVSWLEEFSFNNSSSERKTGSGWPVIRTNLLPNLFTWIWFCPNQLSSTMNCLPPHLLFFNLGPVFGGKIDHKFQTSLSHRFLSNIFCSQSEKQG